MVRSWGDLMRRLLVLIGMLILMLGVANAALSVDISKYQPYPAEPGKYLDVWVTAQNTDSYPLANTQVTLDPKYPFSFDPNTSVTKDIGTLLGGAEAVLQFKVRVDQNAVQGYNFLDVKYRSGNNEWTTKRINVFVQTHDSILSVEKVSSQPETFVPGKVTKVTFELKNMADSFLSDVNVKIDLSNASLPFAPVDSTTEKRIYIIESGKTVFLNFSLAALPDATAGIYKIPVVISYTDGTGTDYSRTDIVSLIVGDKPSLTIYIYSSQILKAGESGQIKMTVINDGLTDIKFLNIELEDSSSFSKISNDNVYIGNLDSDDTDSVTFEIYVNPTNEKSVALPLQLTYMDKNNNEYTDQENIQLRLYSDDEIAKYGLRESSNLMWIIGLIVLAGIGYFVYKRWYKK